MSEAAADTLAAHVQELRRGTVVLACLTVLTTPHYGYALLETLAGAGFGVDGNTLYPLLRRLGRQGLLTSRWDTDEARPRRYYEVSARGGEVLAGLRAEWAALDRAVTGLDEGTPR
ncbi:MAG TPA: PadR family transcriptional regulator [Dermatophilaceae bacterium]|nr:PadR family transcriptional regulator [Dermatophilaceae bacterium]